VAGFDIVTEAAMVRRSIGVALQDAAIDPLMTGRELLKLQGILHGIAPRRARQRGEELLERVGLTAAADRRVGTYSGGMRRRLDLALSLIHEPQVLFLDEPTTGLDPTSRQALWEEVRRLNEHGTSILLTTQYLEEADHLADEILVIDHGRGIARGTADELKSQVGGERIDVTVAAPDEVALAGALLARYAVGDIEIDRQARRLLVPVTGGAAVLVDAVRALDDSGVEIRDVGLRRPTLDDVFLCLTGHLADEEDGDGDRERATEPELEAVR
jgi:ABC-2 type transport system ATP-binding protein